MDKDEVEDVLVAAERRSLRGVLPALHLFDVLHEAMPHISHAKLAGLWAGYSCSVHFRNTIYRQVHLRAVARAKAKKIRI